MKEDLKLFGYQYNYIVVSWTVVYIIGQWVCISSLQVKLGSALKLVNATLELHLDSCSGLYPDTFP
jgi:hypothetical protein